MNAPTTLTSLAGIGASTFGLDTQSQTTIKAVCAAAVAVIAAVHAIVAFLDRRHQNVSAVKIAQAQAAAAAPAATVFPAIVYSADGPAQ